MNISQNTNTNKRGMFLKVCFVCFPLTHSGTARYVESEVLNSLLWHTSVFTLTHMLSWFTRLISHVYVWQRSSTTRYIYHTIHVACFFISIWLFHMIVGLMYMKLSSKIYVKVWSCLLKCSKRHTLIFSEWTKHTVIFTYLTQFVSFTCVTLFGLSHLYEY